MDIKQTLLDFPLNRLNRILKIKQKIEALGDQLENILKTPAEVSPREVVRTRRRMSAAAKARIAKAARARWAKWRREKQGS